MRCSAGLKRLARWAVSGPNTHSWVSLAEATSAAGVQGHLAPGLACASSRRYLWQDGRLANGSMEFSAETFGRLDFPPSILGRELLVPSCAHAVLPGFSRLTPQGDLHEALEAVVSSSDSASIASDEPSAAGDEGEVPEGEGTPPGLECNTKRTYQPSNLVRKRRHGFLARLRTKGGRDVIVRRLRKGRRKITA
ncbi:hypothetical protein WJX81_007811 [Elliptochloris bilobata]|uniref:Large ribosomal subunit protein bL34m n=1 Tax=Elliptochloris bilobata TaxID=381761 RepID=A0AAW1SGN2_9CHLO